MEVNSVFHHWLTEEWHIDMHLVEYSAIILMAETWMLHHAYLNCKCSSLLHNHWQNTCFYGKVIAKIDFNPLIQL